MALLANAMLGLCSDEELAQVEKEARNELRRAQGKLDAIEREKKLRAKGK